MKNKVYKVLPMQMQNVVISSVNSYLHRVRHSGKYK